MLGKLKIEARWNEGEKIDVNENYTEGGPADSQNGFVSQMWNKVTAVCSTEGRWQNGKTSVSFPWSLFLLFWYTKLGINC